jgi:chitodextrinase
MMKKILLLGIFLLVLIPSSVYAAGTPIFNSSMILYKQSACNDIYPSMNDGATTVWTDANLGTSSGIGNGGCAYGGFSTVKNVDGYLVRLTTGATARNGILRLYDQNKNLISSNNITFLGSNLIQDITPTNAYFFSISNVSGSSVSVFEIQLYQAPDTTPPAIPVLTATGNNMSINLSWNKPPDVDLHGYRIFKNGNLFQTITNINTLTIDDNGVLPGTTYNYQIQSYDVSSNFSNKSATVYATPTDTTPPTQPGGLLRTAGDNSMFLTWSASTDNHQVNGYKILVNGILNKTTTSTNTTITGLTNGLSYSFSVIATDPTGNTSTAATINGVPVDTVSPTMKDLIFDSKTETSIKINWSASDETDADYYEANILGQPTISTINHVPGANHSFNFTGLSSGVTYTLRVRAVDDDNLKSIYKTIVVTTASDAPAVPSGFTITPLDNSNNLNWTDNTESDLSGYKIYLIGSSSALSTTTTSAYSHTGLINGVEKCYQLTSFDIHGNESIKSSAVCSTPIDLYPPFDVPNVTPVSSTEYSYTFKFTKSPSSDVEKYKIYKNSNLIDTINDDGSPDYTYTALGLTPNISYSFKINPVDDDGNEKIDGTTGKITAMTTSIAPIKPRGLNAISGNNKITFNWDDNPETDIQKYNIYKKVGSNFVLLATSTTSSFVLNTMDASTYEFSIAAVDDGGSISTLSDSISSAILPVTPTPSPPPFADLSTSPISANDIVSSGLDLVGVLKWIILLSLAIWLAIKLIGLIRNSIKLKNESIENKNVDELKNTPEKSPKEIRIENEKVREQKIKSSLINKLNK